MKITRYFSNGTMNKDVDERLVPNGQFIHAENIRVNINESGAGGVLSNVKGTELLIDIQSLNNGIPFTNPIVIGEGRDDDKWCIYILFKTDQTDLLVEYNYQNKTLERVLQGNLGLNENNLINEINVIKDSVTGKIFLAWTDNLNPIRCINIERCKTFSIDEFEEEDICLIKQPPLFEPRIKLSFTESFEENFIEDKFLHFAYRYQYLDGEYSALSAFTLACFEPKNFYLKYDTMENEGMINRYNQIDVFFNTGSKRVQGIDIVYKESGNNTIYKVQTFQKEQENWLDFQEVSIKFFNNKIYSVLPEKELYRLYDNVPLVAKDLTTIGSSLVLSNYKQGYDMVDKTNNKVFVDYLMELITTEPINENRKSLKSNRSYELGIVYLDKFNRSSSTLVCKENTIFIPISNSEYCNKIQINIKNNPPKWAETFKIVLKSTKETYHNFFGVLFYEEGKFRWIKVEGANKNKIVEGDILLVKSDMNGILDKIVKVKVLEVKTQEENFIKENQNDEGSELKEKSGLYIKIKPEGFDLKFTEDTQREFKNSSKNRYSHQLYSEPSFLQEGKQSLLKIGTGSKVRIYIKFERKKGFLEEFDKEYNVQSEYNSFKEWFEEEVKDFGIWGKENTFFGKNKEGVYGVGYGFNTEGTKFFIRSQREGTASHDLISEIKIELFNVSGGSVVFETDKKDDKIDLFYETGQTFEILNGLHKGNILNQTEIEPAKILLDIFNCYSFGNGVESYRIKDTFNSNALTTDLRPTTVLDDEYKEEHKFSSITWSGNYEDEITYNSLNEFNPSLGNFKKLEDAYGEITRSIPRDNNMIVFQNDKVSNLLHGKKALYNQDGSVNLGASDLMFGDQIPYSGEYGCSNPESISTTRNSIFFIDKKKGIPLKLTEAGINDIYGYYYEGENIRRDMLSKFFITTLKENFNAKYFGSFDAENREYILTIVSENFNKTLAYSDRGNGWSCEYLFISDKLINLNNRLIGIKNGTFNEHNVSSLYNHFYGTQTRTRLVSLFNDYPSDVKVFHAVNIEGNMAWDKIDMKTNLTETTILKHNFRYIEDEWYSAIKRNTKEHLNSLSVQGIGEIKNVENNFVSLNTEVPNNVSIGDIVYINNNDTILGEISSIKSKTIGLVNIKNNPNANDYIFAKKNTLITGGSMRGYYLQFDMDIFTNQKLELYNINVEISKSNP